MRQFFMCVLGSLLCLAIGLGVGLWAGLNSSQIAPVQKLLGVVKQVPWAKTAVDQADSSPFEVYNYPMIKWRPKAVADPTGAIAKLSTKYEPSAEAPEKGIVRYQLILFKAPDKKQCAVELLDDQGFKLVRFDVSDFHPMPGSPDIMEAKDSHPCIEADYKKARDYSIQ